MKCIAVVSGKGGVGKSSVTANLALQLRENGVRVGVLDADVDSPFLAEIIGVSAKVGLNEQREMVPVDWHGIPVVSFALWVPEQFLGATMTGTMHEQWIRDAITGTAWGSLDLLLVDLPAGSSQDEYVAVQRAFGADFVGLVVVALPNVVSGLKRIYHTAGTHRMRILGVVENMSGPVFGTGGVEEFCKQTRLKFFGSIPLSADVRKNHERGEARLPEALLGPVRMVAEAVQPVVSKSRTVAR